LSHTESAMGGKQSKQTHIPLTSNRRIVQNFLLVWLDSNIDETKEDCRNTITHLRRIVNAINLFTNTDQCITFLTQIENEKAFLIVSGSLGKLVMPTLHEISQLDSIYIFCEKKSCHEQWTKQWSKIKGLFTQIIPICESLKLAAQHCDQNSISVSFVSTHDDVSKQNLNQLDPSFMYTQILKEILLEIKYNQHFITDFAYYCRNLYADNDHELKKITKFEREYQYRSPIWWYTYDCCIYSMLNRALRNQEVDTIIKMGFFIQDLHQHIQHLHKHQFSSRHRQLKLFIVYRGQSLTKNDFDKLIKTKGGLISFNNFLSTTKKREVACNFIRHAIQTNPKSIGVLFQMKIIPSVSSAPFASLNKTSYYNDSEEEILFSMHTIFRIGDIERINDFWQVELTLTNDSDQQLSILTEKIRQETQEETQKKTGWPRLGNLLIQLGSFNAAEEVYGILLDSIVDDIEKAYLYHQIGVIKDNQRHYTQAISFYKKSLNINQQNFPSNHPILAKSYKSIALVCNNMVEYSDALYFHHKALEIEEYILPPNHPSLAASYNNIGLILYNMKEYSKALLFYEKTLKIYEKTLPKNHPLFATSYHNIASVYEHMADYPKALVYHEHAVDVAQRSLYSTHPSLQLYKDNFESLKQALNQNLEI
jgi:tetratricopeptide (TPR) repeat protein